MKISMKPIEMIAHFPLEGLPRPMRFRVANEEGEYVSIDIESVLTKGEEKVGKEKWLVYRCECVVNGQKRFAEFKFEQATCRWFLYKF